MKWFLETMRRMTGEKAAIYIGNRFHGSEAITNGMLEAAGEHPLEAVLNADHI